MLPLVLVGGLVMLLSVVIVPLLALLLVGRPVWLFVALFARPSPSLVCSSDFWSHCGHGGALFPPRHVSLVRGSQPEERRFVERAA
jgi:hypothetical protein